MITLDLNIWMNMVIQKYKSPAKKYSPLDINMPPLFPSGTTQHHTKVIFESDLTSHFSLKNELGSGQFGSVYRVRDNTSGNHYALKKIPIKKGDHEDNIDFEQVRLAMIEFTNHRRAVHSHNGFDPHFLQVYDSALVLGSKGPYVAILMQLADGTLRQYIADHRISKDQMCSWLGFLLEGVDIMHAKHLVHRDLHSENIMLVNGTPVIADFGQSCFNDVCAAQPLQHGSSMLKEQLADIGTLLNEIQGFASDLLSNIILKEIDIVFTLIRACRSNNKCLLPSIHKRLRSIKQHCTI